VSTPRQILVPVDLTIESLDALEYALQLAGPLAAGVDLLDVAEPGQREEAARDLDELLWAIRRRGYVAVRGLVESGDLEQALVATATRERHALIVLPAPRRVRLGGPDLERLARRAPCPVVVVPRGTSSLRATPSTVVESWAEAPVA
jgi:nucleotide-binding universal stress UspA family protein